MSDDTGTNDGSTTKADSCIKKLNARSVAEVIGSAAHSGPHNAYAGESKSQMSTPSARAIRSMLSRDALRSLRSIDPM